MSRAILAGILVAACNASQIIYNKGSLTNKDFRPKKSEWPMSIFWPRDFENKSDYSKTRCTATMITDQVAITSAHCLDGEWETGPIAENDQWGVQIFGKGGGQRKIVEVRVADCWNFELQGPWSSDIALLYLDKPVRNAVEGLHYVNLWDP